ncbi:MAG: aldo/keto reductase [Anaerolineae bacterium]|nr:aldo/keto reductase [Anaerolineae bacterium]
MKSLTIPATTLTVSHLCLGTGSFGSAVPRQDAFALLDAFFEAGGNFVDTARVYADWLPGGQNASERTLGEWLQASGLRDQAVVSTKGAHPDLKTMHIARMSPEAIAHDVAASRHYLQIEAIDLYWLHRDALAVPVAEIMDALNAHVQAGQIRYFGCSNWTVARIQEANAYARSHGLSGFVADQPLWSLAAPNAEAIGDKTLVLLDEAGVNFHRSSGMAVIPFTSQAKGYFTKLASGTLKESDRKQYDSPLNHERARRAQALAERYGVSITAIALSYLTSQPFPVIPVIGPKTLDQLRDCLDGIDLRLTPDELADLEAR